MAIGPITGGPEWQVPGLSGELRIPAEPTQAGEAVGGGQGGSFGSFLSKQLSALDSTQQDASKAAMEVANGTASDPASAVMAIERAKLTMQLASQIRTKSVEAMTEVFRTTV